MSDQWTVPASEAVLLREALARGLSRAHLQSRGWDRASHGLYAPRGSTGTLAATCSALQRVLPAGSVFSHLTAGRLYELWLPRLPGWLPVQATLPPRTTRPERRGLWVARSRARLVRPVEQVGLPCLPVTQVVGQLAEDLALVDLVIAIDSAVHQALTTLPEIEAAIRPRQRGAPLLRRALTFADGRSESPWETVLRVFYHLCGFGDVEPQHVFTDERGRFVARGDLWLPGTTMLAEYDGEHHRERDRHRADLARENELRRIGVERWGYTKPEIVHQPAALLRDAEHAYGLPHDPYGLAEWWYEYQLCSHSPPGWNRLLHRLHRFTGHGGRKHPPRLRANAGRARSPNPQNPAIAMGGGGLSGRSAGSR
jgi:hypothetical protein